MLLVSVPWFIFRVRLLEAGYLGNTWSFYLHLVKKVNHILATYPCELMGESMPSSYHNTDIFQELLLSSNQYFFLLYI